MLALFIILVIFAAVLPTIACIWLTISEDESKGDCLTAFLCAMCFAGPVGCGITAAAVNGIRLDNDLDLIKTDCYYYDAQPNNSVYTHDLVRFESNRNCSGYLCDSYDFVNTHTYCGILIKEEINRFVQNATWSEKVPECYVEKATLGCTNNRATYTATPWCDQKGCSTLLKIGIPLIFSPIFIWSIFAYWFTKGESDAFTYFFRLVCCSTCGMGQFLVLCLNITLFATMVYSGDCIYLFATFFWVFIYHFTWNYLIMLTAFSWCHIKLPHIGIGRCLSFLEKNFYFRLLFILPQMAGFWVVLLYGFSPAYSDKCTTNSFVNSTYTQVMICIYLALHFMNHVNIQFFCQRPDENDSIELISHVEIHNDAADSDGSELGSGSPELGSGSPEPGTRIVPPSAPDIDGSGRPPPVNNVPSAPNPPPIASAPILEPPTYEEAISSGFGYGVIRRVLEVDRY